MADARIDPHDLRRVHRLLFGADKFGGPQIARRMRCKHVTLWSWLTRTGMPASDAETLAAQMEAHGLALVEQATALREKAATVRREAEEEAEEAAEVSA